MYLGIDLGTSGVKALLMDDGANVVASATAPLTVSRPRPGWSEQAPADWIEATRAIKPGEELIYDYGIVLDEPHTARLKKIWACRCGAKNCRGTMLSPKR